MGTLEFSLKAIGDPQKGDKRDALDVLLDGTLKYEHVSAVQGAPDGSSEGTSTFAVEIKGALQVAIELHLKMQMVVYFLVEKCPQNDSVKSELEKALYAALEGAPMISL